MKDYLLEQIDNKEDEETETVAYDKESVYLWYTDDTLTNYINSAAVNYNEEHGTLIVPVLQSSVEFLEQINKASIESDVPDLYIVSHNSLGEAYMAGLAKEIEMDATEFDKHYIGQAKNSVSFEDRLVAYPFYYETSAMIYNKTYLRGMAITALNEAKASAKAEEEAENAQNGIKTDTQVLGTDSDSNTTDDSVIDENQGYSDEEIESKIQDILPKKMDDMLNIANDFDAPAGVDNIFTWDVSDIFYNYFFVGDAIDLGGDAGWDTDIIDIYNENAIKALEAYQGLNNFFSIESSESSYSQIVKDFVDGKIIFTIATTDIINAIEQAKEDGEFDYEYGVIPPPDMSEKLKTRTMSVTECVAVNPYSKHNEISNDFAVYLTDGYADSLYGKTSKISVASEVIQEDSALELFAEAYDQSAPIPKMIETGNFWIDLEKVFLEVWNGKDANKTLKTLAEQIKYQVKGEKEELEKIEITEEEEEAVEYIDEEEYRKNLGDSENQ